MKLQYLILIPLFLILFSVSCTKKIENKTETTITNDSLNIKDRKEIRSIGETLNPDAKKTVEKWTEYQKLDEILINFYSISPNEALEYSEELSQITKQLKDSVKIERFKQPDIGIRINVIYNNSLRLADMATINTIKPAEIQIEIQNIINAFSALNSKINNITNQKKLEAEVKDIVIN